MKARFGSYCEVSEHDDITNTQKDRSTPAMCLGPTGNMQGTYLFYNIITGHTIKPQGFKILPYPDQMITLVNNGDRKQNEDFELTFRNRKNEEFG